MGVRLTNRDISYDPQYPGRYRVDIPGLDGPPIVLVTAIDTDKDNDVLHAYVTSSDSGGFNVETKSSDGLRRGNKGFNFIVLRGTKTP